jgi:hypothetical protein
VTDKPALQGERRQKRRPKPGAPGKPLYRASEPSAASPAPPDLAPRAVDPFHGFTFPDWAASPVTDGLIVSDLAPTISESAYRADIARTRAQVDSIMWHDRERQERERVEREQAERRGGWLGWLAAQWQKFKRKVTHPQ